MVKMSFARAKRFVYKEPEVKVSPADYDIPCSLGKVFTYSSECQGYHTKNTERCSLGAKQLNCNCRRNLPIISNARNGSSYNERNFRRGLKACSTPDKKKINITDSDKMNERESIFTRYDTKRISFREKNSSYIKKIDKNINSRHNGKKPLNDIQFFNIEEFFEDDYHGYTSLEDIDSRNTEKDCVKDYTDFSRRNFERTILEKVENVSRDVNNLHNSFKEFKTDFLINQFQQKLNKIENTTNLTNAPSHRKSQLAEQIQNEVSNAIENLKTDFLSQQNSIVRDAILKIGSIAGDLYSNRERCNIQMEDLCYRVVSDLNKNILNLVDQDKTVEHETSLQTDNMELKEIDAILNPDNQFFHYEDICKTLTNHLQISQKELDDLKRDKTDIMIKSCNAHKEISKQTSVLRKFQEELTVLKNSFK
ncbi:uncharacterized protein LOC126885699 isoform X2 [Diabrotica virgifera virgifera]|uniref:Uncharacterized protein n=1 Tax=Diabrotica virgifera virgifera TaxID=50390 RepID=A0ABM5KDV3_DIAVI|nr:uncharacterized protein LOC126885699 isoform X2 [Diabrotica virgifera virgifera]